MKLNLFYSLALLCYSLTLYFFIRLLYWKHISRRYYPKKNAIPTLDDIRAISSFEDKEIPFISVLIPAKNEASVIQKTIHNALALDYPADRYEMIIITDQREELEKKAKVQKIWEELQSYKEYLAKNKETEKREIRFPEKNISPSLHQAILVNKAKKLMLGSFYNELYMEFSPLLSYEGDTHILSRLKQSVDNTLKRTPFTRKDLRRSIVISLKQQFPKTNSFLLKKIITHLEETLLPWIKKSTTQELNLLEKKDIEYSFPTTASISKNMIQEASQRGITLKVLSVPVDYTGELPRTFRSGGEKSTKGRALNYALEEVNDKSKIFGFYDAESQPDLSVLVHVAESYMKHGEKMNILQGPLYQVRNYYTMGIISRIGGLFKAISHEWYLPIIFKTLPFVGGTNLFIRRSLLHQIKGFNPRALTEDLDLGIRALLQQSVTVDFLPVISTEQTPPLWHQFFKQRLRWASGHLEVMMQVKQKNKKLFHQLFWKGPFEWVLYQFAGCMVLVMNTGFLLTKLGIYTNPFFFLHPTMQIILLGLNIPYFFFSFYCFYHYQFIFDEHFLSLDSIPGLECIKLIFSCFFVFLLPLPYTWAVILRVFHREPTSWIKTPRTIE